VRDASAPIVYVVDDDDSIRKSLTRLLRTANFDVRPVNSAEDFLDIELEEAAQAACIVLDVRMPVVSGPELQQRLAESGREIPIVFLTGHGKVPDAAAAMKAGAVDYLEKPFKTSAVLEAVRAAVARDRAGRARRTRRAEIERLLVAVTPRERQVFERVITGMLNKQIALELGTTEKTIKVHRARVMEKLHAESVPDLVRMAEALGIHGPTDRPA
jgi:FixJ family two-component response regulator